MEIILKKLSEEMIFLQTAVYLRIWKAKTEALEQNALLLNGGREVLERYAMIEVEVLVLKQRNDTPTIILSSLT